ncbi:hypothetical protein GPECTOR_60g715 [Gonium pectorale]|uniref:Uncharacterized protein n=1 Tax=Gonium pectorale TaxID=33097 RepID=A0A150G535_GONPE|nr:hypothetical protein GPECTOR_60g715 [Gonium pectorale]|eukprot:KXZ44938.1 hypothetical protein GPECTOR_60g715 [Gonium pectorale]
MTWKEVKGAFRRSKKYDYKAMLEAQLGMLEGLREDLKTALDEEPRSEETAATVEWLQQMAIPYNESEVERLRKLAGAA